MWGVPQVFTSDTRQLYVRDLPGVAKSPNIQLTAAFDGKFFTGDVVVRAAKRFERVGGRNSRDSFAVGGSAELLDKIRAFADAGLPKLILRPLAADDGDTIRQTQLMIDEIQPEIAAMNMADNAKLTALA